MLIDIHVHAHRRRRVTRPNGTRWTVPEELIRMMDESGIDKGCVLGAVSPECRYSFVAPEETLSICAEYPDRLIPFCALDPRMLTNSTRSDFRPLLETYKRMGCKGIGEYFPVLPFDDPLNMNFFKQVEEVGLPVTFHITPALGKEYGVYDELGLPRLEKVLKACPKLKLLGHSPPFWAEISADACDQDRRGYPERKVTPGRLITLMREYPNLYGDLSAGSGFVAISRDPEFGYGFMEEFADRLCFGTDIAMTPQDLPIVPYFRKLKEEKLIAEDAYEKITWRNANRLLGLGL